MQRTLFVTILLSFILCGTSLALNIDNDLDDNETFNNNTRTQDNSLQNHNSFYQMGELTCVDLNQTDGKYSSFCYRQKGIVKSKFSKDINNDALWQHFNTNGNLLSEALVHDNFITEKVFDEHSLRILWETDNGNKIKNIFYDERGNIIQNGISRGYYKNGYLMWEEEITQGKPSGFSRFYYPSGQLESSSSFQAL